MGKPLPAVASLGEGLFHAELARQVRENVEIVARFADRIRDLAHREILNRNCAKTWDVSLEIIKNKNFWVLAAKLGPDFVTYLKAFSAVRAGFASGNFVYGLFVASAGLNIEQFHSRTAND